MNPWTIAPLLVGLSLLMIVFTYCACVTIVKMDQILPRWARQHSFRIIHSEVQTLFTAYLRCPREPHFHGERPARARGSTEPADGNGDSILGEAATGSIDLRICRALIKNGADPCLANKMGSTALHVAAFQGRNDMAQLLVRAGADVNHRDRYGLGPLSCAISRKHEDLVLLLLKNGADPRIHAESLGVAPWHWHAGFVKMLIAHGWDVHSKAYQKLTPLAHARNRKHKSVIRNLTEAGEIQ